MEKVGCVVFVDYVLHYALGGRGTADVSEAYEQDSDRFSGLESLLKELDIGYCCHCRGNF